MLGKVSRLCEKVAWKTFWTVDQCFQKPEKFLTREQRQHWEEKGFLILPQHFSIDQINSINNIVDECWKKSRTAKVETVADIYVERPDAKRVKLHDAPADARNYCYKLNDLFLEYDAVRNLALDPRLASAISELLGGYPLLCNSLNLEFGSQQEYHTDSLYMTPPKKLNLVATWVALEDTRPDAGPLRYYPGSHRIKPFLFSSGRMTAIDAEMNAYRSYMKSEIARLNLREEAFCGRAGDVFVWHSQLFHGGAPIENKQRTRKSVVFHYFRAADIPARHLKVGAGAYYMDRKPQPVG